MHVFAQSAWKAGIYVSDLLTEKAILGLNEDEKKAARLTRHLQVIQIRWMHTGDYILSTTRYGESTVRPDTVFSGSGSDSAILRWGYTTTQYKPDGSYTRIWVNYASFKIWINTSGDGLLLKCIGGDSSSLWPKNTILNYHSVNVKSAYDFEGSSSYRYGKGRNHGYLDSIWSQQISGVYSPITGRSRQKIRISPEGKMYGLARMNRKTCDEKIHFETQNLGTSGKLLLSSDCIGYKKIHIHGAHFINGHTDSLFFDSESSHRFPVLVRRGDFEFKSYVHIDEDLWQYSMPGVFYQINNWGLTDSLGSFTQMGFAWNIYNRIAQTQEPGPSHYRWYVQAGQSNFSKSSHPYLFLSTGMDFSVERNPMRNVFIPTFGLQTSLVKGHNESGLYMFRPYVGLHVVNSRFVQLHISAGYNYGLKNTEKTSGSSASAQLHFTLW
ncbi:MAG: hypothetical protein JNL57_14000 [Bacteroidetes bacterium]|nr:hypothetical protein [Bacteroidota bacterium]